MGRAVCTILQQLAMTVPVNVVYSWGITNKVATQIEVMADNVMQRMAALKMNVHDFNTAWHTRLHIIRRSLDLFLAEIQDSKRQPAYRCRSDGVSSRI